MSNSTLAKNLVLIPIKEVVRKTGLSRTAIYARLNPSSKNYDSAFPKQVRLGRSSVRWVESELHEWIANCIQSSRES